MLFKLTFHDQALQRTMDALEAREKTPEFIAKQRAYVRAARKDYWKSYGFLTVVLCTVVPAAAAWGVHYLFGADPNALTWGVLVGLPVTALAITFPR